jgi:prepilin-type processing-associated H-X9-DG protein
LVVIAIIAVLVGLLLPAVQKVREAANRSRCQNNLKQLGLAITNFHDAVGHLPPGGVLENELAWTVFVLPYIEHASLYSQFNQGPGAYQTAANKNSLAANRIAGYLCPSQSLERGNLANGQENINGQQPYTTHYYAILGPKGTIPGTSPAVSYRVSVTGSHGGASRHGVMYLNSKVRFGDITDGSSNTAAIGEISWSGWGSYRTWMRGPTLGTSERATGSAKNFVQRLNRGSTGLPFNDGPFGSNHPGGAQFAMCDGSVRFVNDAVDLPPLQALVSRDAGELFPID